MYTKIEYIILEWILC